MILKKPRDKPFDAILGRRTLTAPAAAFTASLAVSACLLLAACAQFGVPEVPPAYSDPAHLHAAVLVAYRPEAVLGFGHTGVIVAMPGGTYARFDQYASAEWQYGERLQAHTAHFWEGVTDRLPSIFGFTREFVTRREAAAAVLLLEPGELAVPLPRLDSARVYAAAEARWRVAFGVDQATAPRYFLLFNNCHHFVRDILRAGGTIPEAFFPKTWFEEAVNALPPG